MLGFGQTIMAAEQIPAVGTVFAATAFTGTGAGQSPASGINLTGTGAFPLATGGMVWIKGRSGATGHRLFDTVRGATKALESSATTAEATLATALTAFGTTGFTIGADTTVNASAATYVAWTFRRSRQFFDVVSYTGTGTAQNISHALGAKPGLILAKETGATGAWSVYHSSLGAGQALFLNSTNATAASTVWDSVEPTTTAFRVGTATINNTAAGTFVAYLFAENAPGLIKTGSYTGNGSTTGPTVTLGWEPQFILIKGSSVTGNWTMIDATRGIASAGAADAGLLANGTGAETSSDRLSTSATGFQITSTNADVNTNLATYIYLAVKVP